MIHETRSWIHLIAKDHKARSARVGGKWLCFGPTKEMHAFRDLLDVLVEDGTFLAAKIATKDPATDPFPHKPDCVICVYTSAEKEEIDRAAAKLKQIGLVPSAWKSEAQTRADWAPRGKLALEAEVAQKRRELRAEESEETPARRWDVFISKNSKDGSHARKVYDFLTGRGLKAFLSEVSLAEVGAADFGEGIEQALEECRHLVVVASAKEHLESRWVQAEWRMFLNEVRSGRKTGNVLTVLAGEMKVEDLPLGLRAFQVERLTEAGLEAVLRYVSERK